MAINFKSELNHDQYKAVTHSTGPLLILAGAGSGKTRALTYRAAYLIETQRLDPSSILLLTFTNKSAEEMQNRLKNLVNAKLPFAGTFHSFCAKILRQFGPYVKIPNNYLIYDDSDQLDLIKKIAKELQLPKQYTPRSLLSQISQAKNQLISTTDCQNIAQGQFQQSVSDVYTRYQYSLSQSGAVDFDDLLLKTLKLFQVNPQTLNYFQEKFSHVLIDEYQDTNKPQYLIAKLIAHNHHQLTAVGDASQSIYRWRGADYHNLDYLKSDFPDLTTIKLERNYRSTQQILDAATSVITNNKSHPILSLWTDNTTGNPLKLYEAIDEKNEAQYVINTLLASPANHSTVVLYRTNAQSRAFEEACIKKSVPYTLVGGIKFYERKEIKDILAYLRLIINPNDPVSLDRAEKIGKRRLASLITALPKLNAQTTVTSELFDQVLHLTEYLNKFDPKNEADLERLENIKELQSVALQFDHLIDFLENVSLVEKNTLSQSHNSQTLTNHHLTLMTVHSSKGLEFDQVFIVGLEEGIFPHSRSLLESAELEEERRLCYVAITRARKQVHLTYAQNRLFFGGHHSGIVSRFVAEIPEHLLATTSPYSISSSPYKKTFINEELLDQFLDDEVDVDQLLGTD